MAHDFQTRVKACRQATELLAGGLTMKKAAARVGIPKGTLEAWLRKWKSGGPDNLVADRARVHICRSPGRRGWCWDCF